MNPLIALKEAGQSVWLDDLDRDILRSGRLKRLIDEDGITGVTSNPAAFQKAIEGSDVYDKTIDSLVRSGIRDEKELYLGITMEDAAEAADMLLPVYGSSGGADGFVSVEVSPDLAYDVKATVDEARRLFHTLGRKNVLVKVPATEQGTTVLEQLTYDGVNVNATLLFSLPRCQKIVEAYIRGLNRRISDGQPIDGITSFASFFVSRVDTLIDRMLGEKLAAAGSQTDEDRIRGLYGRVGVSNCRLAYQRFKDIFLGPGFEFIREKGGRPQRLVWGSTGTKDPKFSDIKYVEELVGPMTANTMPLETLERFRDHGRVEPALEKDLPGARADIDRLASLGVNMEYIGIQLEEEGVIKFTHSFYDALQAVANRRDGFMKMAA